MTPPNALLVGDHTDGPNWGGRAQSLALAELLATRFTISGRVPGAIVTGSGPFVGSPLPQSIADALYYRRKQSPWVGALVRLQEAFGAGDVVSENPGASADRILKYSRRAPGLAALRRRVEEADIIVLNGEGSGIFGTPYRHDFFFYLALAELGIRLGKPVFFINTIFSDDPVSGRNARSLEAAERVLARCTEVHVRDPYSLAYARETMPSVRCRYIPDALFTWFDRVQAPSFAPPGVGDFAIPYPEEESRWFGRLDFSRPYICVGGSSLAAQDPPRAREAFARLVPAMAALDLPVVVVETCRGDAFLRDVVTDAGLSFVPRNCPIYLAEAILARARLFVSGRFHPTIMASLGGTPCVFLDAHSHKMASLRDAVGCRDEPMFSTFPDAGDVRRIVAHAGELLARAARDPAVRGTILDAARARAQEAAPTADLLAARVTA